jgi:hypothetical protein
MISECGPGPFVVFISVACVISFVVYLSVEFLKKVLWKVVVPCNGLYCLPFFLFYSRFKWYGMHAGYVKSVRCRFLFYGIVRHKVNSRFRGCRFLIYVHFEYFVLP